MWIAHLSTQTQICANFGLCRDGDFGAAACEPCSRKLCRGHLLSIASVCVDTCSRSARKAGVALFVRPLAGPAPNLKDPSASGQGAKVVAGFQGADCEAGHVVEHIGTIRVGVLGVVRSPPAISALIWSFLGLARVAVDEGRQFGGHLGACVRRMPAIAGRTCWPSAGLCAPALVAW